MLAPQVVTGNGSEIDFLAASERGIEVKRFSYILRQAAGNKTQDTNKLRFWDLFD